MYGLRKQADLVKLAAKHGVVDLLPHTIKKPGEKEKRRVERGLMVKGTGVGQRVKGKKWERTLKGRLQERKKAMLDMPRLIQEWKQVCGFVFVVVRGCANEVVEGTWTGVEEVADREEIGEIVCGRLCRCFYCKCKSEWLSSIFHVLWDIKHCICVHVWDDQTSIRCWSSGIGSISIVPYQNRKNHETQDRGLIRPRRDARDFNVLKYSVEAGVHGYPSIVPTFIMQDELSPLRSVPS